MGEKYIFNNISEEEQEHICTIIGLSNGNFIEVDIQYDLERLQTRSRPRAFGQKKHDNENATGVEEISTLHPKLVEDTFKKIYSLGKEDLFTDEYIMVLSARLRAQEKSLIGVFESFINEPRIREEIQNTRCIEANKIYRDILKVCYDVTIDKQFFQGENRAIIEECILSDDKGRKKYTFCIYAEEKQQKAFYIYSKKSKCMVRLSKEEIQQLTSQVMNVDIKGEQTELKKNMIAFVNGDNNYIEEQIENTEKICIEDFFLEDDEEELE